MDLLDHFTEDARVFWQAWTRLPREDRASLRSSEALRRAFQAAFGIKQALQDHLSTGPPGHRVYVARASPPEHPVSCDDSDSD